MDAKKLQRFSEYSIGTYLLCPKKYRYIYIEKLYTKQKRKINKYFIFGNVIHLACREFYQKRAEERTIENLYNIFREGWRRSGIRPFFKTREEEKELGEKGLYMLSNFYNSFGQKVPYLIEHYMENIFKDYVFFGRVDRIDLSADGTLQIVDYKTNKYYDVGEDNEERERKTVQLKFYANLLNSLKPNVTSASYYHFEDDKFDTIEFKTFERKLGKHCDFCDFYKLCYNTENNSDNSIAYYEEPKEKIDNENSEELFK